MSILIVEPVETERAAIETLLRSWGYGELVSCANLDEARERLGLNGKAMHAMHELELVLIDISAPADSFSRFIEEMRSRIFYQDVPFLTLAEGSRAEKMPMAFAFGAADFVSKPIAEYELRARVRSCMRLKHEVDRRKARERELLEASHQLSDLNRILARVSMIDGLTGIPNRRCFDENFEQEWKRTYRNGGFITLILCDVDFFKQYNDTYGHQSGDSCLAKVGQMLKSCLKRPGDIAARYGGEEFALILPQTNGTQALTICANIRKALSDLQIEHSGSKVNPNVTISMGVASTDPSSSAIGCEGLLTMADRALYEAKRTGRDRFCIAGQG